MNMDLGLDDDFKSSNDEDDEAEDETGSGNEVDDMFDELSS